MKIYLDSKTSKNGNLYYSVSFDYGYKRRPVLFGDADCAEFLGLSVLELHRKYPLTGEFSVALFDIVSVID